MEQKKRLPLVSLAILAVIFGASLFADLLAPYAPQEMNGASMNLAPSAAHLFGTDQMGRDLYTLMLYGGRASLLIGLCSGLISTAVAIIYGTVSGLCKEHVSDMLMRFSELLMSIPSVLLVIFLQGIWGKATCLSLSVIIGLTGWMNIAKIVRSEVRQIRRSDYLLAAKAMGGGFWYNLSRHLLPNFVSSIMFMVVTNIGQAMITEATLSFLGLGLPLTTVSWGRLLSMSEEALLSDCWWLILIPGAVLIVTLASITQIGEYVRRRSNQRHSNL